MHILLVLLILIIGIVFRQNRKIKVILSGFLLFLYAGLRSSSVGIDTLGYERAFYFIKDISYLEIMKTNTYGISRDFFFYWFLKTLQFISGDSQIMFIAIGAIVAFSISVFIYRYSDNVTLSFIIYISLRFFSFSLTGLRAAVAISVILFAYKHLKEKDYFKVVILTLIATLFHGSAIIFLLSIFIVKVNKIISTVLIFSSFLIINLLLNNLLMHNLVKLPFFSQYSSYVLNRSPESTGETIISIFVFTTIAYYFSKLPKTEVKKPQSINFMLLKFLVVGTFFYILNFSFANIFRLGDYFILSIVVLLPNIIKNLKFDKKTVFAFNSVAIILLIMQYIILGPGAGTENYLFFWQ